MIIRRGNLWGTYTYESDLEEERYPVGHYYEGHPIATSEEDPTNWTKVVDPDGVETTYYHFWMRQDFSESWNLGNKLDRKEIRDVAGGTILETQTYEYVKTGTFGGNYIPTAYTGNPYHLTAISEHVTLSLLRRWIFCVSLRSWITKQGEHHA